MSAGSWRQGTVRISVYRSGSKKAVFGAQRFVAPSGAHYSTVTMTLRVVSLAVHGEGGPSIRPACSLDRCSAPAYQDYVQYSKV